MDWEDAQEWNGQRRGIAEMERPTEAPIAEVERLTEAPMVEVERRGVAM